MAKRRKLCVVADSSSKVPVLAACSLGPARRTAFYPSRVVKFAAQCVGSGRRWQRARVGLEACIL